MNGTCTYVDVSQQIGSNNKVSATFTVEPSESTTRAVVSATRAVVSAIAFVRTAINSRATIATSTNFTTTGERRESSRKSKFDDFDFFLNVHQLEVQY